MPLSPGETRARIMDAVYSLVLGGMTVQAAVDKLQSISRCTVYRWHRVIHGKARQDWPELLQSRSLAVRDGADRSRLWRSMRMLRRFTVAELLVTAETSRRNCANYLAALMVAGYLRGSKVAEDQKHGRPRMAWCLVRDTGPHAPKVMSGRGVWDPNRKQLFAEEVDRGQLD